MPAIADITINNGESTPVAKTFEPIGIDANQVATYAETSTGVPLGFPEISLSSRKSGNGTIRVKVNIALPVLESATGVNASGYEPAPAVAYYNRANTEFIISPRSSTEDRADLLAFCQNLADHAVIEALVLDLKNVY
jgi:hypothetical protein